MNEFKYTKVRRRIVNHYLNFLLPVQRCGFRFFVPVFCVLLFFGAMFWSRSNDPFVRKWQKVKTVSNGEVECVAVFPKLRVISNGSKNRPIVFFLHGWGGSLIKDGNELRQLAELGMVTVSLEYNQTNYAAFEEQFSAVLDYVKRQPWAMSNSVAWVGYSLGAQYSLKYLLSHPENRPNFMVRLAGGWVPELEGNHKDHREDTDARNDKNLKSGIAGTQFLFVHGDRDEVVPLEDCRRVAEVISNAPIELKVFPGMGHSLEPNRAVVIREVGEYVKAHLTPEHPMPVFPEPPCYPFLICATPALVWAIFWAANKRKNRNKEQELPEGSAWLAKWEGRLKVVAAALAIWAGTETAIHLIAPSLEVNERSLQIARWKLLAPQWHQDFEALAVQPIWERQKLQTLLTHVELANYCVYELVNWKLPFDIYRDYVLSPVITGSEKEMSWRRPLWEFCYPRIRKENTTEAAAKIVARALRERITVWPGFDRQQGVDVIWKEQITGKRGFELIYVATLRSVGVPARLDLSEKVEFWDGERWQSAPQAFSF